jgi:hypothetical protein
MNDGGLNETDSCGLFCMLGSARFAVKQKALDRYDDQGDLDLNPNKWSMELPCRIKPEASVKI